MPADKIIPVLRHVIPLNDSVYSVRFAPVASHYLLAFGTKNSVLVGSVTFGQDNNGNNMDQEDEEDQPKSDFNYELIHQFVIGIKTRVIAVGPMTNLDILKKRVKLAVSTDNFSIQLLSSQLESDGQFKAVQLTGGHSDFVNDLAFEPQSGSTLASVGDDRDCCLWDVDGDSHKLITRLRLTSAGVSVKWHQNEPNKLFVAEKNGVIRFFSLESQAPMMSFDCLRYPVLAGDWCPNNNLLIGAVADNEVLLWDTSMSSQPIERRKGHAMGGQKFCFFNDSVVASRGRPNSLRVENFKTNQVLLEENVNAGDGIDWHGKEPLLAVGANKSLVLFRFTNLL